MTGNSLSFYKNLRMAALALAALIAAGIIALMVLARGTGEDITGIVAPGLLIIVLSVAVAGVTTVTLRRARS
jgi:hypothetical protein